MRGRRAGAAALILLALALFCLGMAALLLSAAPQTLPRGWALLRSLSGPAEAAGRAARHAIEGAALVTAICAGVSLALAWALASLPARWAELGRALIFFPALTIAFAWAIGFAILLQQAGPVRAALGAASGLRLAASPRAHLVVLLTPLLANALTAAWRSLDPVALRAAETLGIAPGQRFRRLVLPVLAGPLLDGAALAFLAAAAVLAMRVPQGQALDRAAIGAIATIAAAIVVALMLLWRGLVQRTAS